MNSKPATLGPVTYAVQVWDGPGQPRRTYDRDDEITDCETHARQVARTMCAAGFDGGGAAVVVVDHPDGHPGSVVARYERGAEGIAELQS